MSETIRISRFFVKRTWSVHLTAPTWTQNYGNNAPDDGYGGILRPSLVRDWSMNYNEKFPTPAVACCGTNSPTVVDS